MLFFDEPEAAMMPPPCCRAPLMLIIMMRYAMRDMPMLPFRCRYCRLRQRCYLLAIADAATRHTPPLRYATTPARFIISMLMTP